MDCYYKLNEIFIGQADPDFNSRYEEYKILNDDFLDTGRYPSEYINYDGYNENIDDEHPLPEILNDQLIKIIIKFIENMGLLDKIPNSENIDWSIDPTKLRQIITLRNVLGEQILYMERELDEADDLSRRFSCKVFCGNDQFLGEIYAFQNPNIHSRRMVVQAISHSLGAGLAMIIFPEIKKYIPRLNSIIEIALENLAQKLNIDTILVYPLMYQGKILQKHYGYQPTDILFYPSPYILGGSKNLIDYPPKLRLFKTI